MHDVIIASINIARTLDSTRRAWEKPGRTVLVVTERYFPVDEN